MDGLTDLSDKLINRTNFHIITDQKGADRTNNRLDFRTITENDIRIVHRLHSLRDLGPLSNFGRFDCFGLVGFGQPYQMCHAPNVCAGRLIM
jgi:hypothetical protein